VTKPPRADDKKAIKQWTDKQLDALDEVDDATMAWAEREPYRRGVSSRLSVRANVLTNLQALTLLASNYLLDHFAWKKLSKRKDVGLLNRAADYAADDARRIIALWKEHGIRPHQKQKSLAAEIAAERHLRLTGMSLSDEDRDDLEKKVERRITHPSGISRAKRRGRPRSS
jgi:hypothetical protein